MNLLRSLLLKLGMFAMTLGVVWWIGMQVPQTVQRSARPQQAPLAQSNGPDIQSSVGGVSQGAAQIAQLVDLNRATAEDFEQLPGVGPVLARRVVAYRESRGGFHAIEELRGVKGIGQKKLERLRRLVRVAPPSASDKGEKAAI